MKALQFKNKILSFVDKPKPMVNDHEVLIKPLVAGICNTDIELFEGYYHFDGIPGHEFVGIVDKSPGNPHLEGKRVVCEINIGCRDCRWCRIGSQRHCLSRRVIGIKDWDGAFAEYVKAPLENIHNVDETISNEIAVFVEPLAASLQLSQQIHIRSADRMAVLGDGKLGLLTALALRHCNPDLILIGKHRDKLAIASEQGVKTFHRKSPELILELKRTRGCFAIVVDATGKAEGINEALELIRPEGTIVVKTTSHKPSSIQMSRIVVDEIKLLGSRCGDFGLALAFLKNKWVDVLPLVEATYEFHDFNAAFDHARRPGAKKILIKF
ncbi:MAG: alcohol dehydrogenase catalytic domain-containing protein [Desulfoferrobacter sp.]